MPNNIFNFFRKEIWHVKDIMPERDLKEPMEKNRNDGKKN